MRTSRRTATPVTFGDGVLVVRADSTAWATQVRLLSDPPAPARGEELGEGAVSVIEVHGPARARRGAGARRRVARTGPAGHLRMTCERPQVADGNAATRSLGTPCRTGDLSTGRP